MNEEIPLTPYEQFIIDYLIKRFPKRVFLFKVYNPNRTFKTQYWFRDTEIHLDVWYTSIEDIKRASELEFIVEEKDNE